MSRQAATPFQDWQPRRSVTHSSLSALLGRGEILRGRRDTQGDRQGDRQGDGGTLPVAGQHPETVSGRSSAGGLRQRQDRTLAPLLREPIGEAASAVWTRLRSGSDVCRWACVLPTRDVKVGRVLAAVFHQTPELAFMLASFSDLVLVRPREGSAGYSMFRLSAVPHKG